MLEAKHIIPLLEQRKNEEMREDIKPLPYINDIYSFHVLLLWTDAFV